MLSCRAKACVITGIRAVAQMPCSVEACVPQGNWNVFVCTFSPPPPLFPLSLSISLFAPLRICLCRCVRVLRTNSASHHEDRSRTVFAVDSPPERTPNNEQRVKERKKSCIEGNEMILLNFDSAADASETERGAPCVLAHFQLLWRPSTGATADIHLPVMSYLAPCGPLVGASTCTNSAGADAETESQSAYSTSVDPRTASVCGSGFLLSEISCYRH